jgi:hypothetical protein
MIHWQYHLYNLYIYIIYDVAFLVWSSSEKLLIYIYIYVTDKFLV